MKPLGRNLIFADSFLPRASRISDAGSPADTSHTRSRTATITCCREDFTAVTRSADLLREGRELLLDLVDRAEVRDAAAAWTGRVNTVTARTDRVDVDALLIRPDGCVAWALPTGQDLATTTLVRALGTWSGQPA